MEDCVNKMSQDAFNIVMEKLNEALNEIWDSSTSDVVQIATLANLLDGLRK